MPEQQPVTPESLFDLRWVSDPQIAPDGQWVAYVEHWVEEIEKDGKKRQAYRTALYLSEHADAKPRRLTYAAKGNDSFPRWSPDGRELAFISTRDDDKPQLFVLDLAGGEAQQITRSKDWSEGVGYFDWHPSGALFLIVSAGNKDEDEQQRDQIHDENVYEGRLPFKFNGAGLLEERREQIYRISRDGSEVKQLTTLNRGIDGPVWSPDGHWIAFGSQNEATPEYTWIGDIFVIGADGGEPRQITQSNGEISTPFWSPDSKRLGFLVNDLRYGNATTSKIYVAELESGESRCIMPEYQGSIGDIAAGDAHLGAHPKRPVWDAQDRITFEAMIEGRAGLYRIGAAGGAIESINTSGLSVTAFSQQGNALAFTGETNTRSAEVYASVEGHKLERRSHAADKWFSTHQIQAPEHIKFKGADGWELEGWAIKPLGFADAPDAKYPLLIYVHGGPHTAYGNGFFQEFQAYAAAGFGLFFVNPRGSSSYGEEFANAVRQHFGEKDYEDIMHTADLAASWEWVDPQRMGIMGGSYGGFMTNWIITHTDRFAAACTQRSISNLLSFAGTSDIGPEFSRDEYGALPWTDEELLMSKSPIRYVQNVKTPTLILHQEEDHRCPIEQAEQLYTALVVLGVPTKFVRFPNENHDLPRTGQPQRRVNRMHHIIDWFTRYLINNQAA